MQPEGDMSVSYQEIKTVSDAVELVEVRTRKALVATHGNQEAACTLLKSWSETDPQFASALTLMESFRRLSAQRARGGEIR